MKNIIKVLLLFVLIMGLTSCEIGRFAGQEDNYGENLQQSSADTNSKQNINADSEDSLLPKDLHGEYNVEMLTAEQQKIYQALKSGLITEENPYMFDYMLDYTSVAVVLELYKINNCLLEWCNNEYYFIFKEDNIDNVVGIKLLTNKENDADIIARVAVLDAEIENIISQVPENATEYEKIVFAVEYIVNNVQYDNNSINAIDNMPENLDISKYSSTDYGAFINKKAICGGYTLAVKRLLDEFGVKNILIKGDVTTSLDSHAWNLVWYNGKWNHIDATWMDAINAIDYNYFLVNDKQIGKTHYGFKLSNTMEATYYPIFLPPKAE